MGIETPNAVLTDRVLQLNFTNEGASTAHSACSRTSPASGWCNSAKSLRGERTNLDYAELTRLAESAAGPARDH
jgi:hypothetical protein